MQNLHFKYWPKDLPKNLEIPDQDIYTNLKNSSLKFPKKKCIIFENLEITYEQLDNYVNKLSFFLTDNLKIKKGDRILLDLQSSPHFIISYYAILKSGCVVVPISPMSVKNEIEHYIQDSGSKVAIFAEESLEHFSDFIGAELTNSICCDYTFIESTKSKVDTNKKITFLNHILNHEEITNTSKVEVSQTDLAAILYTSGTTGKPKGCVHTHETIMYTLYGAVKWENMNDDSIALSTAPMFHVTGMQHSLNSIIFVGGTLVIMRRWNPENAGLLIEKYKCTHWANVPTMVVDLLASKKNNETDLSSLSNIFGGGASMPEAVAQQLFDRCGIHYMEGYGMTEAMSQTHMNPAGNLRKQCLGIPTFNTKSMVINPDNLKPLEPNNSGEIIISCPQLMKSYWNNKEATDQAFITIDNEKYFRSGDLGYMDKDGFFYIADRLKRMINSAGFKVWPAEVEGILYKNKNIKEVAIISSPDQRKGEIVMAAIVLKDGIQSSAEEIISWSRENMSAYKIPRKISFMNSLPRSGSGKIQWRELQDLEWKN